MSIDIEAAFDKFDSEYIPFNELKNPRSNCSEIHAFLLLNELVPTVRMIDCAEHDQIWLSVSVKALAEVATEDHIRQLSICGVFYDSDVESLSMYR